MVKKNFKYVVIGHVIAIAALVVFLFLMRPKDDKLVSESMIAGLFISLIVQLIIYSKKPEAFDDKVKQHPDKL